MRGEPIEAVKQGIQRFLKALRSDVLAIESAMVSVITYSDKATQIAPLTEVLQFQPPTDFHLGGQANMGNALKYLLECVDKEVVKKRTEHHQRDVKPFLLIMSNGISIDEIEQSSIADLASLMGCVVALTAGKQYELEHLNRLSRNFVESIDEFDFSSLDVGWYVEMPPYDEDDPCSQCYRPFFRACLGEQCPL